MTDEAKKPKLYESRLAPGWRDVFDDDKLRWELLDPDGRRVTYDTWRNIGDGYNKVSWRLHWRRVMEGREHPCEPFGPGYTATVEVMTPDAEAVEVSVMEREIGKWTAFTDRDGKTTRLLTTDDPEEAAAWFLRAIDALGGGL